MADQEDSENREEELAGNPSSRKNQSSLAALSDKGKDVLDDQSKRGQVWKLTEHEARKQHPDLVEAALGANRKDKPNGVVSARILFDGQRYGRESQNPDLGSRERAV